MQYIIEIPTITIEETSFNLQFFFFCAEKIFYNNKKKNRNYSFLACELLTKNMYILSPLFLKPKSSMSSQKTITESRNCFLKGMTNFEDELNRSDTLTKKLMTQSVDYIIHKSSKEDTYKLIEQKNESGNYIKIDIEDEEFENEFMLLFFSFFKNEENRELNDTLCGYFEKVFSCLICQIRTEVILLLIFYFFLLNSIDFLGLSFYFQK